MKRCTACFRYALGDPPYCNHCGRSYDVRLCPRGHENPRGASFCGACGSGDLSTPAPPAGFLFAFSQAVLRVAVPVVVVLIGITAVLGLLVALDWSAITPRLILLVMMLGILYWTTTLLPGPVKKVSKAAGKTVWKAVTKSRKRQ
jgi:hypothetical protein